MQRWYSSAVGEGLIFDLRASLFDHVQRMPLGFFTRTQTGALISRMNNDVIGAQRALTGTLGQVVFNVLTVVATLGAPLDVGAADLALETFLPSDEGSATLLASSTGGTAVTMGSRVGLRITVTGSDLVLARTGAAVSVAEATHRPVPVVHPGSVCAGVRFTDVVFA